MKSGFSLIEVCVALGVATFAIIALLSLLPVSLGLVYDTEQEGEALNILQEVIADRAATPANASSSRYGLPALSAANTTIVSGSFGVQGDHQINTSFAQSRWRVDYTIYPLAQNFAAPFLAHIKVSWPAASTRVVAKSVESVATFPEP